MILIVAAQFDKSGNDVIAGLMASAIAVLETQKTGYEVLRVPGAVETPLAAQRGVEHHSNIEAVIALTFWSGLIGYQLKAETDYLTTGAAFENITQWVQQNHPERTVHGVVKLVPVEVFDISLPAQSV